MADVRSRFDLLAGVAIGMASSFGSQLLWRSYTSLQQSPAINLHFRPVQIRVDSVTRSCPLNRQRLQQLAGMEAFRRSLAPEARFALDIYAQGPYSAIPVNAVSREVLDLFADKGLIPRDCSAHLNAPLSLEVAYILREQVPYVVDRDCDLEYNGHHVPVELATSNLTSAGSESATRAMVIKGTDIYMASVRLDPGSREAFAGILSPSSTQPLADLRLRCRVIADDRRVSLVGNARPVAVPIARSAPGP